MDSDRNHSRESGFTMVEMAIVMIVIGLIMGMMQVSGNLQRNANYNRLIAQFVLSWRESYNTFFDYNGYVVGDGAPVTGQVNGEPNALLCGEDLLELMANAGVEVSPGRARGLENLDLYQAPDGIQRQMEVCFLHVTDWYVGPDPGDTVPANVMVLTGVSADLASKMDATIDGYADAAWGDFRSAASYTSATAVDWPVLYDVNGDVNMVTIYFRMSQ
jgi:prepilin-type N-terminal cleavage/methylation domain-containing protein